MRFVKQLMVLMVIILGLFTVTACSNSEGEGDASSDDTLTYAYWSAGSMDLAPVFEKAEEIFHEKYPDTELKQQVIPRENYWTKLRTSVGGGSGPDVFLMNGVNFEQFKNLGLIKNLQSKIEQSDEVDMSNYPKGITELYTADDDVYGLPFYEGLLALYYNKEIFDNAGVPYPDETWTWKDTKEKGKQLSNAGEDIYGMAMYPFEGQEGLYPLIKQAGGKVINEDKTKSGFGTPETTSAIQFMQDLINEGIMPSADILLETDAKQLFSSGRAAMYPSGTWNINLFQESLGDKVGVAVLPHNEERGYLMHGSSFVMNAKTGQEEKAFELMKIFSGLEFQKIFAESGENVPAHVEAIDLWAKSEEAIDLTPFQKGLEHTEPYPVSLKTTEWQEAMDEQITKALMMKLSAEEASKSIEKSMNKVLESEKK